MTHISPPRTDRSTIPNTYEYNLYRPTIVLTAVELQPATCNTRTRGHQALRRSTRERLAHWLHRHLYAASGYDIATQILLLRIPSHVSKTVTESLSSVRKARRKRPAAGRNTLLLCCCHLSCCQLVGYHDIMIPSHSDVSRLPYKANVQ